MHAKRMSRALLWGLVCLSLACSSKPAEEKALASSTAPLVVGWGGAGAMAEARKLHAGVVLQSGKVLVTGGSRGATFLASATVYDPGTGIWTVVAPMPQARQAHTATLLNTGKVLVAGGEGSGYLSSTAVYDPATNTWASAGTFATGAGRGYMTATELADGRVLVAGGLNTGGAQGKVDVYEPATGTWAVGPAMRTPRRSHTATLLKNGKVLVVGGWSGGATGAAELYDPATNTWSVTGALTTGRYDHTATLLPSGKVLVVGGRNGTQVVATAEVYDPDTGTWSVTSAPGAAREFHTATLLSTGQVLVAGGRNGTTLASAELYEEVSGQWSAAGVMASARYQHAAVLLEAQGKVLVVGGVGLATAELYAYDACAGVSCNSAPGPCYEAVGTCGNGVCSYAPKAVGASCDDTNACTGGDVCNGAGVCAGTATSCNSAPGQCYVDTGTCSNGTCTYQYKAAGEQCNDQDACTVGEVCNGAGGCAGTPVSCNSPPNTQCYEVAGTCSGGACTYAPKAAGTPCNDGNGGTINDVCSGAGVCAGVTACTTPPSACHTAPGTYVNGACTYPLKAAGSSCGAGQICTATGQCQSGCWIGGAPHADGVTNPNNSCQQCKPSVSTSSWSTKTVGTSCSDGDACTVGEVCNSSGACVGGSGVSCNSPPSDCYQSSGTCSGGGCNYAPKAWGAGCSNGDACTVGEYCNGSGACIGGSAASCNSPPSDCYEDSGTCSGSGCNYAPKPWGASCSNGNACTVGEFCNGGGACIGGSAASCNSPPNDCYQDTGTCSGGGCNYAPKPWGSSCSNGNACTVGEFCNGGGSCIGGSAASCNSPPNDCYQDTGTCSGGGCNYAPKPWGSSCSNGNACTVGEFCNGGGSCIGGSAASCNSPPNDCYQDTGTCSGGGCNYAPKPWGSSCSNGNACTVGEFCNGGGACIGGSAASCNSPPSDCYEDSGTCSGSGCNYAPKPWGASCSNGNACTVGEFCNGGGACIGGSAASCNSPPSDCYQDTGSCTGSGCNYAPKPWGSSCSNGNACTVGEFCNGGGSCIGGSVASCNSPPNDCYQDTGTCSGGGCNYAPKPWGSSCSNGNACTVGEFCNGGGACIGGSAASCNSPPGQCYQSSGTCSGGGCNYTPLPWGTSCSNGNACVAGEVCNGSGSCVGGSSVSCNSPPGQCYQSSGTCSGGGCNYTPLPWGTSCSNGNACVGGEVCNGSGSCVGGSSVSCNSPPGQCYQSTGTCSGGGCNYTPLPWGASCDDGNGCTSGDMCNGSGSCSGTSGCGGGSSCVNGSCQCGAGYTLCDGVCRDLLNDNLNCGACGNNCHEQGGAHWVCSGGYCMYTD
jgi:hypothetical protein